MNWQDAFVTICADKRLKPKDIAELYCQLYIHTELTGDVLDWPTVNLAISKRWPKGLKRIKNLAWKYLAGKIYT